MEIISRLKNLSQPALAWITLCLVILTLLTSLLFGTLSIMFVKDSERQLLLIRHIAQMQLINKLEVQNVHYISKDVQPTSDPKTLPVWKNFGICLPLKKIAIPNLSSTKHSSTLHFNYGNICTHYQGFEPIFKSRSLYSSRFRQNLFEQPLAWCYLEGNAFCFNHRVLQLSYGIETSDNFLGLE